MLPKELHQMVRALSDEQLRELIDLVMYSEPRRRRDQVAMADAVSKLQDSGELSKPEVTDVTTDKPTKIEDVAVWANPGTIHSKMYRLGDVVAHRNRVWESTHPGLNHWEPGAHGIDERIWRDITDELWPEEPTSGANTPGAAQDGAIPFKAGLNLKAGDVVVYQGVKYRVVQPHTSQSNWTPDAVPALFSRL